MNQNASAQILKRLDSLFSGLNPQIQPFMAQKMRAVSTADAACPNPSRGNFVDCLPNKTTFAVITDTLGIWQDSSTGMPESQDF
jgi:hypothetical protein